MPPETIPGWAEQRLALALEASGIAGAWDWDAATGLIHGDARACALHGVDPALGAAGAPGPTLLAHVVPEDRPALDRALAAALAGRAPLNVAYRTWPPGGDVAWVLLRGRVLRDGAGAAIRLAGVALDVTEGRSAEAALRESEARFRAIADTMPQAVWSSLPDGRHDYFNRRWYEMTGLGEAAAGGGDWTGVIHPDDRARVLERWHRALLSGEPYEAEHRLRAADGAWRWFLGRALPVRDARGRIARWFGTCTDVDDLRRAVEEREVLSHELNHRIKNVFSVILSLISLSARGHPEADAFAGELRGRIGALARAHDLARPDGGPARGTTTLFRFLHALLAPYDPSPGQEPRIVVSGTDRDVDEDAAPSLALLFHELATNAAKYGALSTQGGRIAIEVAREGEETVLRWRERGGPAIPGAPGRQGFGSRLAELSVQGQLRGRLTRLWPPEGLELEVRLPPAALDRRGGAQQEP